MNVQLIKNQSSRSARRVSMSYVIARSQNSLKFFNSRPKSHGMLLLSLIFEILERGSTELTHGFGKAANSPLALWSRTFISKFTHFQFYMKSAKTSLNRQHQPWHRHHSNQLLLCHKLWRQLKWKNQQQTSEAYPRTT